MVPLRGVGAAAKGLPARKWLWMPAPVRSGRRHPPRVTWFWLVSAYCTCPARGRLASRFARRRSSSRHLPPADPVPAPGASRAYVSKYESGKPRLYFFEFVCLRRRDRGARGRVGWGGRGCPNPSSTVPSACGGRAEPVGVRGHDHTPDCSRRDRRRGQSARDVPALALLGAFPISRSRAHTHRRHGHPLQTVPSAGLIERPQEKNRVDALR